MSFFYSIALSFIENATHFLQTLELKYSSHFLTLQLFLLKNFYTFLTLRNMPPSVVNIIFFFENSIGVLVFDDGSNLNFESRVTSPTLVSI
jgi:hypothetical protein